MKTDNLMVLLDQVEAQLGEFSAALLSSRAEDMQSKAKALQVLVLELSSYSRASQQLDPNDLLKKRLHKLAALLASHRESLWRHSVMAESALAALMPASQVHTYGSAVGAKTKRGYAGIGRQSGEFKMSAA